MKSRWLLFFVLAVGSKGLADSGLSIVDTPRLIEKGQAKRLFIVGYAGSLTLIANNKNDDVIIKATKISDGQDPTVNKDFLNQYIIKALNLGDIIEIRAQPQGQVSDWNRWASTPRHLPEVKLEVTAPPTLSVEAYWTRGDIRVSQWKAPVFLTNQEGRLTVDDGTFDVTTRTMFGALHVENIKGTVSVENFGSQVSISDVTGKTRVRTFSGDLHLKKLNGVIAVSSQKASVTTQDTTGTMEVQSGLAGIHILSHKGRLVGHSDAGAINAKVHGAVDVHLSSKSGPLSVFVGRESQAQVHLSTKGMLNAPKELEKKSGPDSKVVSGALQGREAGSLRLVSDTGDLTLRVF